MSILSLSIPLKAQTKFYFTDFWRLTTKAKASFYRVGMLDSIKQKFIGQYTDYRIDGSKLQEGSYDMDGQNYGLYKSYFQNGTTYCEGNYSSNEAVGIWRYYFSSGSLEKAVSFEKDEYPVIVEKYNILGDTLISDGTGTWNERVNSGVVIGKQQDYKRIGEWKISMSNGYTLITEWYHEGKLLGDKKSKIDNSLLIEFSPNSLIEEFRNHDAKADDYPIIQSLPESFLEIDSGLIFTKMDEMPTPRLGEIEQRNFVNSQLKYLSEHHRSVLKGKRIYVQLTINRLGNVSEAVTIKGVSSYYDREAERVFKMTKWIPGYQKGVPVNVRIVKTVFL